MNQNECQHLKFDAHTHIARHVSSANGTPSKFIIRIKARCAECKRMFYFVGRPQITENDYLLTAEVRLGQVGKEQPAPALVRGLG